MSSPAIAKQEQANPTSQGHFVLGVDGGGTKSEAWIARVDADSAPEKIGTGSAGSTNAQAVDMATAQANLAAAVASAWHDAGLNSQPAANAVFALAGSGLPTIRRQIEQWSVDQQIALRVRIVHDCEAVIATGTPDGWGVGLISGTGSVAMAKTHQKQPTVAGGWGYWFGDEGSAYWIGQSGLRAVAQAADGRAPATALTQAILEHLQITEPRDILGTLAKSSDVRHSIAAVAEIVTRLGAEEDPIAEQIVEQAAQELALLVGAVSRKAALDSGYPLALAGGVLHGSELMRDWLLIKLAEQALPPGPVELVRHPVAGCVQLAYQDWQQES